MIVTLIFTLYIVWGKKKQVEIRDQHEKFKQHKVLVGQVVQF